MATEDPSVLGPADAQASPQAWPWNMPEANGDDAETPCSGSSQMYERKKGAQLRHSEWERLMEGADQQQAELQHFQWALIRDQVSVLARDIGSMQHEISELQGARKEDAVFSTEGQALLERESAARLQAEEGATLRIKQESGERMRSVARLEADLQATRYQVALIDGINEQLQALAQEFFKETQQRSMMQQQFEQSLEDFAVRERTAREGQHMTGMEVLDAIERRFKSELSRTSAEQQELCARVCELKHQCDQVGEASASSQAELQRLSNLMLQTQQQQETMEREIRQEICGIVSKTDEAALKICDIVSKTDGAALKEVVVTETKHLFDQEKQWRQRAQAAERRAAQAEVTNTRTERLEKAVSRHEDLITEVQADHKAARKRVEELARETQRARRGTEAPNAETSAKLVSLCDEVEALDKKLRKVERKFHEGTQAHARCDSIESVITELQSELRNSHNTWTSRVDAFHDKVMGLELKLTDEAMQAHVRTSDHAKLVDGRFNSMQADAAQDKLELGAMSERLDAFHKGVKADITQQRIEKEVMEAELRRALEVSGPSPSRTDLRAAHGEVTSCQTAPSVVGADEPVAAPPFGSVFPRSLSHAMNSRAVSGDDKALPSDLRRMPESPMNTRHC